MNQQFNQPFPNITYRRGASGQLLPVLCGTGLRVQTVVLASQHWGLSVEQIAAEYDLKVAQVRDALSFYGSHAAEIDAAIAAEQSVEAANV